MSKSPKSPHGIIICTGKAVRRCLGVWNDQRGRTVVCDRVFMSTGPGHRICPRCAMKMGRLNMPSVKHCNKSTTSNKHLSEE